MRIEFYVLPGDQQADREQLACKLALKAWHAGLPVFLRCSDEEQCRQMDALLWRFRGESFLPHNLCDEDPLAPVVIGLEQTPQQTGGLLLNLGSRRSGQLQHFQRIIEIVDQEPQRLAACRENFLWYKRQGYDPARVEL
jgi:DNA polymerase-3 subunit chi